jgi:hypothetical protein
MAGPITWRTVNGPSLAEASRPLEAAQRSLDTAFTGLGGLIKQQETTDSANWNQIKENNTQDFLNKLYSVQGAEGFKALQDSGELERMIAANGAQIDRAAARSAMDGRLANLQQRDVASITYKNTMLDDAQAGEVRRINTLALTDPAAASAELAKNPDLRKSFEIAKNIDASAQTQVERERAKTRFGFDQNEEARKAAEEKQRALLRPIAVQQAQDNLLNGPAQRAASAAQAAAANEQSLASRARRQREEAEEASAKTLKKLGAALDGNIYKEGVYKDTDSVDIAKLMKDTGAGGDGPGDNDQRRKVLERINKLAQTGIELTQTGPDGKPVKTTVPLPLGAVKAALLGSGDSFLSWNEGYADSFEKNLKTRLQAVYNKPGANGQPTAANRAVDDYQNFLAIMRGTAEVAPAPSSKRK